MRSVASWLACLLDVSADLGNPCVSLADNFWSSSAEGLMLCERPTVGEKKEGREEKSSSTTYNPRQVLLLVISPPFPCLCLPPHPLLQVLQYTESPLC